MASHTQHARSDAFFKYSTHKNEIGFQKASDHASIGPNLAQVITLFHDFGLSGSSSMYLMQGRPGGLYVAHRRLFSFGKEGSDNLGQIYELAVASRGEWSQYLSVVLDGEFDETVCKRFHTLGFSGKPSCLGRDDYLVRENGIEGLWLDDLIHFEDKMPGYKP